MTTLSSEALDRLAAAVQVFLPSVSDPQHQPSLSINPIRVTPTGIGGFVGVNTDPAGQVFGRRVDARVLVTVKAPDLDGLRDAVSDVTRALAGAEGPALQGQGILRVVLEELGPLPASDGPIQREVSFRVLYEYLKLPTDSEGIIAQIPLDLETGETGRTPRVLFRAAFSADSMALFDAVDDPLATSSRPSRWQYNATAQCIEQVSSIRGGPAQPNPNKPGTYLVLKSTPARPPVTDFILRVGLRSEDIDGIGLVFRYQDSGNFYFYLMERRRHYRLLAKKVAGTFQALEVPALDVDQGFDTGVTYAVKVTAHGQDLKVYLDNRLVLQGQDPSLSGPGMVGFMARGNEAAQFYSMDLVQV